jgi:D-alanyl-D-alanine carboxypeptidase
VRKYLIIGASLLAVATGASWWYFNHGKSQVVTVHPVTHAQPTKPVATTDFNMKQFSLTDPTSPWVIANKQHPLQPTTYAPTDLRQPNMPLRSPGHPEMQVRDMAATSLEQLNTAAAQAGIHLQIVSGYRSYDYQVSVYNGYVHSVGQDAADQESARPGYSEHQTGLAVDLGAQNGACTLEACFGTTPEGIWLAANVYKYGFILRYPADKIAITGYEYEPWHFRYVGPELALQMHDKNIQTLEEFFNVTGGTSY